MLTHPRRRVLFARTVAWALLALAAPASAQTAPVPRVEIEGRFHAFLPQLCARYGVQLDWNPAAGVCVLRRDGRSVEGRLTSARWLVNGRFVFGHGPLREYQDVPVIIIEDIPTVLGGALGRELDGAEVAGLFGPARPVLPDAPPQRTEPTLQSVRSIPYPRYTRVVLTFDDAVQYDLAADRDGRVRITLPGVRVGAGPGPLEIADDVVKTVGWRDRGDAAEVTILAVQADADYDAYYLEDPVRLILDFRRTPDAAPFVVPGAGGVSVVPQPEPPTLNVEPPAEFTTVVVDPGHGGRDPGAQGSAGLFEKTVTLAIAEKLKVRLEAELGLTVVLTRNGDYHVSLAERTQIANTARDGVPADLFLSLHTNSIASVRASGFEAYFVSEAVDPSADATAALENSVVNFETTTADGANDLLREVLWDLQFAAFTEESNLLAVLVQEHLGRRLAIENRGVKQAPFLVLSACAMPSVLVEIGFISNRAEEVILQTPEFQNSVATALTSAVAEFKARQDRRLGVARGASP